MTIARGTSVCVCVQKLISYKKKEDKIFLLELIFFVLQK